MTWRDVLRHALVVWRLRKTKFPICYSCGTPLTPAEQARLLRVDECDDCFDLRQVASTIPLDPFLAEYQRQAMFQNQAMLQNQPSNLGALLQNQSNIGQHDPLTQSLLNQLLGNVRDWH